MLNELLALQRGLADAGVSAGARHPDLKELGKVDVIRVRLTEAGAIGRIELVLPGDGGALWTLRDGQQNGFPGLKTPAGLLEIPPEVLTQYEPAWRAARQSAGKRHTLLALLAACRPRIVASWPKPGHKNRIAERFEQLNGLSDDPHTAAVPAAFAYFLRALQRNTSFLVALTEALTEEVSDGDEAWLPPAWAAFTGPTVLFIDVVLGAGFTRGVSDVRQIGPVSVALRASATQVSQPSAADCALSGPSAHLLGGNFPQPNLPGIGQTYIFARNRDIPAMARYARSGPASMPVDAELAGRLNSAVSALADPSRLGRTWRLIPAEAGDRSDLFLASLPADPEAPSADAIAGTGNDEEGWPFVEMAAEGVTSLWQGRPGSASPQAEMQVLLLRTVDPANRKAVFTRRITASTLHDAAVRWWKAMHNTPDDISFIVLSKTRGAVLRTAPALAPLSLVRLSRQMFVNGGRRVNQPTGEPASEALALFLRDGGLHGRATRVLRLLLQRQQGLCLNLRRLQAMGSTYLRSFDPRTELRRQALQSVAWLGALLCMLGYPREVYMEDFSFKLGQLLSAMDAVHIGYCADMRGGDIPPTLLGNSVFATAGRDPKRALEVLQGRWKPYDGWAKGNRPTKAREDQLVIQIRRGRSQARLAGILSEQLRAGLASVVVDERHRAELLLGYLAGIKPERKAVPETTSSSNEEAGA